MKSRASRQVRLNLQELEQRDVPSSSSISGLVFADANNNGVADQGESALAGVGVTLIGHGSQNHLVYLTQKTSASGTFDFANLAPGVYTLEESAAPGYIDGLTSAGSQGGVAAVGSIANITLPSGVADAGNDLGQLAKSAGWSSIQSDFNFIPIHAGDTLWFSSVFTAKGLGTSPVTLNFTNQTISYVLNGSDATVSVPNSTITLSPTATTATTTFNSATDSWNTTLPSNFSGSAFLGGVEVPLPNGLPGGVGPVTWLGQFSSSTAGVTVNWQWGAAAYKSFSANYNALNVDPVAVSQHSGWWWWSFSPAGTPQAFTQDLVAGAGGFGGTSYTGWLSFPATVKPPVAVQQALPASLSGSVTDSFQDGISGLTVDLEDSSGNVLETTTTATDGSYSFTGLKPGVYQILVIQNSATVDSVGTVNGVADGTDFGGANIGDITLQSGNNGINYNIMQVVGG
jgi:hypothetical protein